MEQKKEQGVVNQILQKQKIEEISAVSGATCSSQAICNLYRQALLMAANTDDKASDVKSSESPAVNSPKPEETLIPTPEPSYAPLQPLKNGSYSETTEVLPDEDGDFSSYRLSADVVFKENAFAGFENVEISDITNKFYTNRALNGTRKSMGLLNQLIGAQKDDALVVTGGDLFVPCIPYFISIGISGGEKTVKTKVIKWINMFLVLAVLFGYQWIALGNQKKRDDYKQQKMENEKKMLPKWKNGVYYGEAEGFGGPVKLKVTIQSNKIKSITVISAKQETKEYWNMAATLLDDITKKQSSRGGCGIWSYLFFRGEL